MQRNSDPLLNAILNRVSHPGSLPLAQDGPEVIRQGDVVIFVASAEDLARILRGGEGAGPGTGPAFSALSPAATRVQDDEPRFRNIVPISRAGRLAAYTSLEYDQVVVWEVNESAIEGEIDEIALITTVPASTEFRLTISGNEQWTDQKFQASLSTQWKENRLPPNSRVLLEARSTDSTPITVDGFISGSEKS